MPSTTHHHLRDIFTTNGMILNIEYKFPVVPVQLIPQFIDFCISNPADDIFHFLFKVNRLMIGQIRKEPFFIKTFEYKIQNSVAIGFYRVVVVAGSRS